MILPIEEDMLYPILEHSEEHGPNEEQTEEMEQEVPNQAGPPQNSTGDENSSVIEPISENVLQPIPAHSEEQRLGEEQSGSEENDQEVPNKDELIYSVPLQNSTGDENHSVTTFVGENEFQPIPEHSEEQGLNEADLILKVLQESGITAVVIRYFPAKRE